MTTYVLVHGGWHGSWCWRRLASLLAGHDVHTPTLTGTGDRSHLHTPVVGLADHIADVVAVLDLDDLRNVVLVGHSSAGAVISGVAQQRPERTAELVYLDAFVPPPGRSVLDLLSPQRRAHFVGLADAERRVVLDPDQAMDGWAVTDPGDRAFVGPRLRPHPLGALADPLPDHPLPPVARTYIHCTRKPGGDSFAEIAAAAAADPCWRYVQLDAGHDAMITAPDGLAAALDRPRPC